MLTNRVLQQRPAQPWMMRWAVREARCDISERNAIWQPVLFRLLVRLFSCLGSRASNWREESPMIWQDDTLSLLHSIGLRSSSDPSTHPSNSSLLSMQITRRRRWGWFWRLHFHSFRILFRCCSWRCFVFRIPNLNGRFCYRQCAKKSSKR